MFFFLQVLFCIIHGLTWNSHIHWDTQILPLFTVMGQNTGPGGCLFKEACPGCFEDSKLIFSKVLSVKRNCAAFPKDFLTPFISANH